MTVNVPDDYVYLDWAATAPLCEEAARAMAPYLAGGPGNIACGGNANSLHAPGRAAFEALELARRQIARDLGASRPNEVIFTSGATESDNTALLGIGRAACERRRVAAGSFTPHLITTEVEHEAVLEPAAELARAGWRVTYLKPDRAGFVSVDDFIAALGPDTVLASIQMANSEVGAVQRIAAMAEAAHGVGALFHTDAVQALGKVPINLSDLGVDAASFAAHKICGPKGIGALYVKARTPYAAIQLGGGQEEGRRSGTQNVAGAVGFAAACHAAVSMLSPEVERERALRDKLYAAIGRMEGVEATVNVPAGDGTYLPNIVHALADGLESETLILRLDMKGFGVSGGSACSSHSLEPSRVLRSLGIAGDKAYGALRMSFGRYTTERDIDAFIEALAACIAWERE